MAFEDLPRPEGHEDILPKKGPREAFDGDGRFANVEASHGVGTSLSGKLEMYKEIDEALKAAGRPGFSIDDPSNAAMLPSTVRGGERAVGCVISRTSPANRHTRHPIRLG
jgi:hypothetical protein